MNILQKINNELNESKLTQKALKEKYPNITPFYKNLHVFSLPVNNKSKYDRKNTPWGLYDIELDQVILDPVMMLTFGEGEKKNIPNHIKGGELFQNHALIKTRKNDYENYYDLDTRSFIFPDIYSHIEVIRENTSSVRLFEARTEKSTSIIDKNNKVYYEYKKNYIGDITIFEHNGNMFSVTSRYDWADSTSIVNMTKNKMIIDFGEYNKITLNSSYGKKNDLILQSGNNMWLVAENKGVQTLVCLDTGERRELKQRVMDMFGTSKGIYSCNRTWSDPSKSAEVFNIFNESEKYIIKPPYEKIEDLVYINGELYAYAVEVGGTWAKSLIVLKPDNCDVVAPNLPFNFKIPKTARENIVYFMSDYKPE